MQRCRGILVQTHTPDGGWKTVMSGFCMQSDEKLLAKTALCCLGLPMRVIADRIVIGMVFPTDGGEVRVIPMTTRVVIKREKAA